MPSKTKSPKSPRNKTRIAKPPAKKSPRSPAPAKKSPAKAAPVRKAPAKPDQAFFDRVFRETESLRGEAVRLLRGVVRIPGESNTEGERLKWLKAQIEKLGFADEVFFDAFGNLTWRVGSGKRYLYLDGHTDTVGTGPLKDWEAAGLHPYDGKEEDGWVWGRGAADQLSGVINQVIATWVMKKLGLLSGFSVYSVGSVQEEDNDGAGPRWIFTEGVRSGRYPRPEVVILTEGTGDLNKGPLGIYRGHRGRTEIQIETFGRSCHGSNPDIGDNAIGKMAPIIDQVLALHREKRLPDHPFLGRGSVTISRIADQSASNNCVAPYCRIILDRRITAGETRESILRGIANLPAVKALGSQCKVSVIHYVKKTWNGQLVDEEIFYPAWETPAEHPAIVSAVEAYRRIIAPRASHPEYRRTFRPEPRVDSWIFSTDGVGIPLDIPRFGFSSGIEQLTHIIEERVDVREMIGSAALIAAYPAVYAQHVPEAP